MFKSLIVLSALAVAISEASAPLATYGLGHGYGGVSHYGYGSVSPYSYASPYSYGHSYGAIPYGGYHGYEYAAPVISKAVVAPVPSYHTPYAADVGHVAPISTSYANTYKVSLKTPLTYPAAAHYSGAAYSYPYASSHYGAYPSIGHAYSSSYPSIAHGYSSAYPSSIGHGYPSAYGAEYYHH